LSKKGKKRRKKGKNVRNLLAIPMPHGMSFLRKGAKEAECAAMGISRRGVAREEVNHQKQEGN